MSQVDFLDKIELLFAEVRAHPKRFATLVAVIGSLAFGAGVGVTKFFNAASANSAVQEVNEAKKEANRQEELAANLIKQRDAEITLNSTLKDTINKLEKELETKDKKIAEIRDVSTHNYNQYVLLMKEYKDFQEEMNKKSVKNPLEDEISKNSVFTSEQNFTLLAGKYILKSEPVFERLNFDTCRFQAYRTSVGKLYGGSAQMIIERTVGEGDSVDFVVDEGRLMAVLTSIRGSVCRFLIRKIS